MDRNQLKRAGQLRRKRRIRKNVQGTSERPRMSVYRSNRNISVQLIDDIAGVTLCQAASLNKDLVSELERGSNQAAAKRVGSMLAERAQALGIRRVVFDRNGYRYHGRVKSLAEAAREKGLEF